MEVVEDVVIVGAGIAGLTLSLGLHRLGYKSVILESSETLRSTGFAITIRPNGWRALDALGVGDSLREHHLRLNRGEREVRCVRRAMLLETLGRELPVGTIRFSSRVVRIEESGYFKLVHLADGTILKTKALAGCDGVNSAVAKWLGFKKASYTGRSIIRGSVVFESNHCFEHKFHMFSGEGMQAAYVPCDDRAVYWFVSYTHSSLENENEIESDPLKMKQYILTRLGKGAENMIGVIEKTELSTIGSTPLSFRPPWEVLWGNITRGNVCVAGDALHPMTPDLAQGGGCALEDGIVLARCIVEEALSKKTSFQTRKEEYKNIKSALEKYGKERKWRSVDVISTSYIVGRIRHGNGKVMRFLRDNLLSRHIPGQYLRIDSFIVETSGLLEAPFVMDSELIAVVLRIMYNLCCFTTLQTII